MQTRTLDEEAIFHVARGISNLDIRAAYLDQICAGEEPYSVALIWSSQVQAGFRNLTLYVLATDADETMLQRAERASYPASSLKQLPDDWIQKAFIPNNGEYQLLRSLAALSNSGRRTSARTLPMIRSTLSSVEIWSSRTSTNRCSGRCWPGFPSGWCPVVPW